MKLVILSKKEVISYKPNEKDKTVIIRIHEPEEGVTPLKHEALFSDELYVFFHDIHGETGHLPDDVKVISLLDAKRILQFAERHKDADTMVVHCHAGISRSASVALAISWLLNLKEEEENIFNHEYYVFNLHVLTVFANLLGIEDEKSFVFEEMERRIKEGAKKEPFSWDF